MIVGFYFFLFLLAPILFHDIISDSLTSCSVGLWVYFITVFFILFMWMSCPPDDRASEGWLCRFTPFLLHNLLKHGLQEVMSVELKLANLVWLCGYVTTVVLTVIMNVCLLKVMVYRELSKQSATRTCFCLAQLSPDSLDRAVSCHLLMHHNCSVMHLFS